MDEPQACTAGDKRIGYRQTDEDDEQNNRYVQQDGAEAASPGYEFQASVTTRYVHGGVFLSVSIAAVTKL